MSVLFTNNPQAECTMNEQFSIHLGLVYLPRKIAMLHFVCLFVLLGITSCAIWLNSSFINIYKICSHFKCIMHVFRALLRVMYSNDLLLPGN